jgi:hypothetical protein
MVAPIWAALKARPLGTFPYRWATYWSAASFVIVVAIPWLAVPIFLYRGIDARGIIFLFLGCLSWYAGLGLFARVKAGAVCLIASEVLIFLLPAVIGALYNSPVSAARQISTVPILVLIVVNVVYFKKRWSSMGSGLWSKELLGLRGEKSA